MSRKKPFHVFFGIRDAYEGKNYFLIMTGLLYHNFDYLEIPSVQKLKFGVSYFIYNQSCIYVLDSSSN